MQELRLSILDGDTAASPQEVETLRADLDLHVGPTAFLESSAQPGAKGILGLDMATLAVSLLSAPALVALVNVLKSYFDSDRVTEIELSGPGGTAKLKLPPRHQISTDQIRQILDSVLGQGAK